MLDQDSIDQMMHSFGSRNIPPYVLAATLAAELRATKRTAKQLSLCSMNATAITTRAEEWGKGFAGITQYINETAKIVIQLADQVGELAQGMTQASVKSVFEQTMATNLDKLSVAVLENHPQLSDLKQDILRQASAFTDDNRAAITSLKISLQQIKDCNRTLNSIVAICRIEASRAGPFQDSLWAIADAIETSVATLRQHIQIGDRLMSLMEARAC